MKAPWVLAQRWDRLLFAHWRAAPQAVRRLLPPGVEVDVYDGSAWVAIVAFVMRETRGLVGPRSFRLSPIPELNVRTYVRVGGVPAVWFLSLDASSPVFVGIGRALYGMDYHLADMTAVAHRRVHFLSVRADAAFAATYWACGEARRPERGSLEHFLVERYRLFAQKRGRLVTAEVAHEPWPLRDADARIDLNAMAPQGISFAAPPLLHFCDGVDALVSGPLPAAAASSTLYRSSRDERRFDDMTELSVRRASGRTR